jgi:hypothetical protein
VQVRHPQRASSEGQLTVNVINHVGRTNHGHAVKRQWVRVGKTGHTTAPDRGHTGHTCSSASGYVYISIGLSIEHASLAAFGAQYPPRRVTLVSLTLLLQCVLEPAIGLPLFTKGGCDSGLSQRSGTTHTSVATGACRSTTLQHLALWCR